MMYVLENKVVFNRKKINYFKIVDIFLLEVFVIKK